MVIADLLGGGHHRTAMAGVVLDGDGSTDPGGTGAM
jgi:hypothetical protein